MKQTTQGIKSENRVKTVGRSVWPAVVLGLLCIAFYWEVLSLPADRTILGDDATNLFLQWLRFAKSSAQQGELPLWNPYTFSGFPFVANPQPALFYPPTWIALFLPITRAMGLIAVLHLWVAGVGMIVWLRSEGASVPGALVGGAVFAFSGYFAVRVRGGHLGVITTGAWLPLLLWSYRQALTKRSWRWAILGGLPAGLSILAGHSASFIYVALGLAAYAALDIWERWKNTRSPRQAVLPLGLVAVILVMGLVLAAVQLVPMTELLVRSTRGSAAGYEFAARFSWPPGYLLTLLVPNFFGEPTKTGYWGDGIYDEFIFYVGILPLLLTVLGLRSRHRLKPFLVVLGLGALLLAFGEYAALHPLFYRFMPLFRLMRAPARAGFLFTLVAAATTALIITRLQHASGEERNSLLGPLSGRIVLGVVAGGVVLALLGYVAFAIGRDTNPAVGRLWHQANQTALFVVMFLLASALLIAWRGASAANGYWLLALGVVLLDLWTFGGGVIKVKEVPESAYWRIVAEAVPDPQAARVLPWGLNEAEQNGSMAYELRNVLGYDPLIRQRYEDFITSRPDPRAHTYDLLNAGYLVTTGPMEFGEAPNAPTLLVEDSGVFVYERPRALPNAWITSQFEILDQEAMLDRIHDPAFDPLTTALLDPGSAVQARECVNAAEEASTGTDSEVDILRYETNRLDVAVRGAGGLLILSELDYPGWRAKLDGEPVELLQADYLLRALCVPAGEHRIEMVYEAPLLKIGLLITGVGLLLIAGAIIAPCVRRRASWS
jgi:hypothetical protein